MKTIFALLVSVLFCLNVTAQKFKFNTGDASEGSLVLVIECTQDSTEANISIRDLTGKIVWSEEMMVNCGKLSVNIETLQRGVYVVAMHPKSDSSLITTKKFYK